MKYYNNLLILFTIALKCGADEEPTTVNDSAVENVTNSEVFSASSTEGKIANISSSSETNGSENTVINATDNNVLGVKKKVDLSTPRKLAQQGTRMVKNIIGSLMKGLTQLNKPDLKEDAGDNAEPSNINYSSVEIATKNEVSNASTTEAPENFFDKWTQLPNISISSLINASDAYAINPFKNKEFGKLPIPRKLPRHRTRLVTNITGSLMNGLAQLNKTDSEEDTEDDEEPTTVNYSTIENVTNSEISNARTTGAPEHLFDKWMQLPMITKSTLIDATDAYAINPFKNKDFGKLPIPRKLPRHRTRLVANITGNLMKALAQLNKQDSEEDSEDDEEPTTVNYSTVENVINSEISNASTTEVPENLFDKWTLLPNINSLSETLGAESTRINLTATTVSPFKKKEFGKLPIPRRPQRGSWLMKNITGSLMDGLAQLNEMDSEDDEENEEPTTVNYSTVENVSNSEVSNASTTEVPGHRLDEWIQLPNISSSSGSPATENILIKVTDGKAVGSFTKTQFGKLPKLGTLPQQGARIVTNIVGSLLKGLARETDSNEDEDGNIKKI